jgi:hypothetical protein
VARFEWFFVLKKRENHATTSHPTSGIFSKKETKQIDPKFSGLTANTRGQPSNKSTIQSRGFGTGLASHLTN